MSKRDTVCGARREQLAHGPPIQVRCQEELSYSHSWQRIERVRGRCLMLLLSQISERSGEVGIGGVGGVCGVTVPVTTTLLPVGFDEFVISVIYIQF